MEEKAAALRRLSRQWADKFPKIDVEYQEKARAMEESAEVLRKLLAERET